MTRTMVKQILKTKLQGLIARGVDVEEIDQEIERYCIDLYKTSGHLLKEEDILEIYEEIATDMGWNPIYLNMSFSWRL